MFAQNFGHTFLAISFIIAAFMFGLMIGSWSISRFKSLIQNEIKTYSILEILIGVYALFFPFLISVTSPLFGFFLNGTEGLSIFNSLLLFCVVASLIFIPTFAMGATLPLLTNGLIRIPKNFKSEISKLYFINTIGAAFGALISGFLFIEFFGLKNSLYITGVLNILIGLTAFFVFKNDATTEVDKSTVIDEKKAIKTKNIFSNAFLKFAAFYSGLAAIGIEIIWTRCLKFSLHNSTYSFSIVLFVYLLGIGIGSYFFNKYPSKYRLNDKFDISTKRYFDLQGKKHRPSRAKASIFNRSAGAEVDHNNLKFKCGSYFLNDPKKEKSHKLYGKGILALICFIFLSIVVLYVLLPSKFMNNTLFNLVYDYQYHWGWSIVVFILIAFITLFIPTFLMGFLLPLLMDIYHKQSKESALSDVGSLYAINTFGGILGSLLVVLFLIPTIGIKWSVFLLLLPFAFISYLFLNKNESNKLSWSLLPLYALIALFFYTSNSVLTGKNELNDSVVYYKEGADATVKVWDQGIHRRMSIDGITIAGNTETLLIKEKLLAHLPFMLDAKIDNVLNIGLASGITIGSLSTYDKIKKIDAVEIMQPVFEASKKFEKENRKIWSNNKIHLIEDDIFKFLKYKNEKYDLIVSDGKLGTLNQSNSIMLSREFYELSKNSLSDEGVFIQWLPLITPTEILEVVLETLSKSFDEINLFYFYPNNILMTASNKPLKFNVTSLKNRPNNENLSDLKSFGFGKSSKWLTSYIGKYEPSKDTEINSLNRPFLDFWYLRKWKYSSDNKGGHRASNIAFLKNIHQKNKKTNLKMFSGIQNDAYRNGIYNSTFEFLKFAEDNFKSGDRDKGMKEFEKFVGAIPGIPN